MSDDINKMDFKQLRKEVQLLRDELALMQRKYEDILYNLDNENFSSQILQEKDDMKGDIEINAKSIKTKVSSEEFESTITQVDNKIETEVSKTISVQFNSDEDPNERNDLTESQKEMLCNYKGKLYYYNNISKEWKEYDYKGVNSKFIQTADGFEFTNDVRIDAGLIVNEVRCTKLYSKGNDDGYSQMNSSGLVVFDKYGNEKIGLEYICGNGEDEETAYPFLKLGVGGNYKNEAAGCILKLGRGLWIGDNRGGFLSYAGDYPGNASGVQNISSYAKPTGIFIDIYGGKVYKYIRGEPTEL